jgi:hypothetical protein
MNLFKRMCGGLGLAVKIEVIHKNPFLWFNAKFFNIKAMAAVVLLPCLVELAFAEPRKVLSKDSDGLAVSLERFNKDAADVFSSGRTLDGGDFRSESGHEFLRNGSKGVSLPNVKSNDGSGNAAKNCGFWSSYSHDDLWSAIGIIPSLRLMFWAANLNKPNYN